MGCDLERVAPRSDSQWLGLLGRARYELAERIARESASDLGEAATRVWAAHECLVKAGWIGDAPLVLARTTADGWSVLASGSLRVATYVASIDSSGEPTVVAVLAGSDDARL
jgi:enediyne polyketide synthase